MSIENLRATPLTGAISSAPNLHITPAPWTVDALCAQVDTDLFFPEKGGSTRDAKKVCKRCTVAAECLIYALEHDERFGIWGGCSERERRKLAPTTKTAVQRPHVCDVEGCGHAYSNERSLRDHRRLMHGITRERPTPECGTEAGYRHHLNEGTETCGPCRGAHNENWARGYLPKASKDQP